MEVALPPSPGVPVPRSLLALIAPFLVVAQIGVAPMSVPREGAATAPLPGTAADDCCSSGGGSGGGSAEDDSPGDCCPDGCRHCASPCCGGSPALAVAGTGGSRGVMTFPADALPVAQRLHEADPRAIYHPPRA
jgi:hypothetical protein